MSSWMMRTSLLKRGGRPKCMIQLSRAPIRKTTSAFWSAWLRAAPTEDRVPDRHVDVERDAMDVLDRMRELAEWRRDQHLTLFLERSHASPPGLRSAADQDHRPAILLSVGEAGEGVDDAGARHDEAGARAPGQITHRLRGIRGGLLVPHSDVGDAFLLCGRGDRAHRKPDDPEHELDALLFEVLRD